MKDNRVYLRHIYDAILRVEAYTAGGRAAFLRDSMIHDAVVRNLEIVGEAVSKLTPDFKSRHPESLLPLKK